MKHFLFRLFAIPCSHRAWKQLGPVPERWDDLNGYWWECVRCGKQRIEDEDWPAVGGA